MDHLLTGAIAGESGQGIVGGPPTANPRPGNLNLAQFGDRIIVSAVNVGISLDLVLPPLSSFPLGI